MRVLLILVDGMRPDALTNVTGGAEHNKTISAYNDSKNCFPFSDFAMSYVAFS